MENVSFSIPHLRKIIFKIYTQKIQDNQKQKQSTKIDKKSKHIWYLGHTDFENFRIEMFDVPG